MATVYYVTAYAIPSNATELPRFKTDMARFFTREDADDHAEELRSPGFGEVTVEPREEA